MLTAHQRIAGYELIAPLGAGRSGEVWQALALDGGSIVALKVFHPHNGAERIAQHELDMACCVEHPNVLRPLDLLMDGDCPSLVLSYCDGRSVEGLAGHLTEARAWALLGDVAAALDAIHEQRIAHLDVKPSNILWHGGHFLISDFGAAQCVDAPLSANAACDASSFMYDAPERAAGTAVVAASDIWALGATVFNLVMGCQVFNGTGGRTQQANSPLPFMRRELPELSEIVQRCLCHEPAQRPTAEQLVELARHHTDVPAVSPVRPMKPQPKRHETLAQDFWPDEMF